MEQRSFGASGLGVTALGFGAGGLGRADLSESDAERLLSAVLDHGIGLIDTARSYGASEERLGRYLGSRRARVTLSTKAGYGIVGVADWSPAAIARGIDEALVRMRTDWIDIFHLHSCSVSVLEDPRVLAELDRARAAGKIRVVAYSGENLALSRAAEGGRFGGLQCSVSVFDQSSLTAVVPTARACGIGLIAKRPLANAPWRRERPPQDDAEKIYRARMQRLNLDPAPWGWLELCLRFAAFAPGVSSVIVGTTHVDHLSENARAFEQGPLPAEVHDRLRRAWAAAESSWGGLI